MAWISAKNVFGALAVLGYLCIIIGAVNLVRLPFSEVKNVRGEIVSALPFVYISLGFLVLGLLLGPFSHRSYAARTSESLWRNFGRYLIALPFVVGFVATGVAAVGLLLEGDPLGLGILSIWGAAAGVLWKAMRGDL